jgi:hypothetical protein
VALRAQPIRLDDEEMEEGKECDSGNLRGRPSVTIDGLFLAILAIDKQGTNLECIVFIPEFSEMSGYWAIGGDHYDGLTMYWGDPSAFTVRHHHEESPKSHLLKGRHKTIAQHFNIISASGKTFPGAAVLGKLNSEKMRQLRQMLPASKEQYRTPLYFRDANGEENTLHHFINYQSVLDMVVFGGISAYDKCTILESISPQIERFQKEYCLIDKPEAYTDSNTAPQKNGATRSLNRCSAHAIEPFRPDIFRYGVPSPMAANDCSGALVITIVDVMNMEVEESSPTEIPSYASENVGEPLHALEDVGQSTCSSSRVSPHALSAFTLQRTFAHLEQNEGDNVAIGEGLVSPAVDAEIQGMSKEYYHRLKSYNFKSRQ